MDEDDNNDNDREDITPCKATDLSAAPEFTAVIDSPLCSHPKCCQHVNIKGDSVDVSSGGPYNNENDLEEVWAKMGKVRISTHYYSQVY